MRRSGMLLIGLGLVLALISSLGVYSILQRQTASAPAPTPTPSVKVVVAAQNIPDRTALQAQMLVLKDWPPDLVPPGGVSSVQDLVGKITAGPLVAGELVLMSKVSLEREAIGLAPTLPPGLVAMSLATSPMTAVGGAIREGDTVDILVSLEYSIYNAQGDESKPLQATFYSIQDVPILSVTGQADSTATTTSAGGTGNAKAPPVVSGPSMVTILVTPQDALLIKYARERGNIDLVLRSPQFHDQVVTDPVYLDYITRRFELPQPILVLREAARTGEPQ